MLIPRNYLNFPGRKKREKHENKFLIRRSDGNSGKVSSFQQMLENWEKCWSICWRPTWNQKLKRKRLGLHRKSCVHLLTVIPGIPACASSSGMTRQVLCRFFHFMARKLLINSLVNFFSSPASAPTDDNHREAPTCLFNVNLIDDRFRI